MISQAMQTMIDLRKVETAYLESFGWTKTQCRILAKF